MSDEDMELIRQALEACGGSLETLIRRLAENEPEERRRRRLQIENGPDHPSDEQLYDYVLGWLSREDERYVLDHISICRVCLADVLRIRRLEEPALPVHPRGMDWIVVGGGAYRRPENDLDIRVVLPNPNRQFVVFDETDDEDDMKGQVEDVVDIMNLRYEVKRLIGEKKELDIGVVVYTPEGKKTVLYGDGYFPKDVVDFKWFKWCYYLNRGV